MTDLHTVYSKAHAANDRVTRAINRLNWLNCHRGPDAFQVHADALAQIEADAKRATAEWTALAQGLTAAEIVAVMTAA